MHFKFLAGILVLATAVFADNAAVADSVPVQEPVPGLDLPKLTAQDSEDYGEYSRRITLVEDSSRALEGLL